MTGCVHPTIDRRGNPRENLLSTQVPLPPEVARARDISLNVVKAVSYPWTQTFNPCSRTLPTISPTILTNSSFRTTCPMRETLWTPCIVKWNYRQLPRSLQRTGSKRRTPHPRAQYQSRVLRGRLPSKRNQMRITISGYNRVGTCHTMLRG
uniref:Uncharacterized protein n=1 Tax=Cacopsylla melanoneura TaxID=428564 RepID=A0A8D8Z7A3_9HEMI